MASGGMNLEQQFGNFSKYGDPSSDGKTITLTNVDKWLKQAKLFEEKIITTTNTGVCFNKWKSRTINFQQFVLFLEDLAKTKSIDADELKQKLMDCGLPGANAAKDDKTKK